MTSEQKMMTYLNLQCMHLLKEEIKTISMQANHFRNCQQIKLKHE